jgi:hypothetical protein
VLVERASTNVLRIFHGLCVDSQVLCVVTSIRVCFLLVFKDHAFYKLPLQCTLSDQAFQCVRPFHHLHFGCPHCTPLFTFIINPRKSLYHFLKHNAPNCTFFLLHRILKRRSVLSVWKFHLENSYKIAIKGSLKVPALD